MRTLSVCGDDFGRRRLARSAVRRRACFRHHLGPSSRPGVRPPRGARRCVGRRRRPHGCRVPGTVATSRRRSVGRRLRRPLADGHGAQRREERRPARRRYRRFLATLPAAEDTPDHTESFLSHRDPRTAQVVAEIGRARQADAVLLSLTALEGFTVREAAAAVGISEPAARMRLSRFRTQLRTSAEARVIEGEGT